MHRNWPLSAKSERELATVKRRPFPGATSKLLADIFETDEALTLIMEMPGVEKKNVSIEFSDVLRVDGQTNFSKYEGMEPNEQRRQRLINYARVVWRSGKIDRDNISAELDDGVLTLLTLPKVK